MRKTTTTKECSEKTVRIFSGNNKTHCCYFQSSAEDWSCRFPPHCRSAPNTSLPGVEKLEQENTRKRHGFTYALYCVQDDDWVTKRTFLDHNLGHKWRMQRREWQRGFQQENRQNQHGDGAVEPVSRNESADKRNSPLSMLTLSLTDVLKNLRLWLFANASASSLQTNHQWTNVQDFLT